MLSQMNPAHNLHVLFLSDLLYIILNLRLGLPNGLFPTGIPTKILYAFPVSPMRATCTLLDLITMITFGEEQPTDCGGPHYAVLSKFDRSNGTVYISIYTGHMAVHSDRNKKESVLTFITDFYWVYNRCWKYSQFIYRRRHGLFSFDFFNPLKPEAQ
jgi:hypothetical protein